MSPIDYKKVISDYVQIAELLKLNLLLKSNGFKTEQQVFERQNVFNSIQCLMKGQLELL